jgi:hypothetical protein
MISVLEEEFGIGVARQKEGKKKIRFLSKNFGKD